MKKIQLYKFMRWVDISDSKRISTGSSILILTAYLLKFMKNDPIVGFLSETLPNCWYKVNVSIHNQRINWILCGNTKKTEHRNFHKLLNAEDNLQSSIGNKCQNR